VNGDEAGRPAKPHPTPGGLRMLALTTTLILAFLAIGGRADADTSVAIRFSVDEPGNVNLVSGAGSFTFADGLTTVGLGDLKGFFFTAWVVDATHGGPQLYDYQIFKLLTLSATFEAGPTGPTLTSLSLSTSPQPTPQPLFPDLAFHVTSLATGGAFMETWTAGVDEGVYAVGTITIRGISTGVSPVPEPSGAIPLGLGATAVALGCRRRRAVC
jgi:hypothetical protein